MTIPKSFTEKDLPEHLSPEILMGVLYIHKGKDTQDKLKRSEHVYKKLGEKKASFVIALLILPQLMEDTMESDKYKDFIEERTQRTMH
jgi:hypothetical protein